MPDKLERLLTLTATLLWAERPLTADELRQRVPGYPDGDSAFRRQFERDKEALREHGVPLRTETLTHRDPPIEGYVIRKSEYYLEDPGLEPDELAALHLAATVVRVDGLEGLDAFWKLGGRLDATDGPEQAEYQVALPSTRHLVAVYQAFAARAALTFTYRGEPRLVDPYRLDSLRGRWYLSGFDHSRGEERNFRVDRIEGEVEVGRAGSFERPTTAVPGQVLQPWELGEGDPLPARLAVDADHAPRAVQHVGEDAVVERRDDGSVVIELPVTNRDAFRSFVITFLDHAEVLSPPELRADFVAWMEQFT